MNSNPSLTDAIEGKFKAFLTDIEKFQETQKIPGWFKQFFDPLKTFLMDVTNSVSTLESQLAIQKSVTDALLKDRDTMSVKLENQLQYTRRNMVLLHGVEEKREENTDNIVLKVAEKIGVKIGKNHLNRSHRLGPKRQNSKRPRPIICSFISYEHKKALYDSKKKLKGTKTVITESLTKSRFDLYQKCCDKFGKISCWTYDGKI